MSFRQLNFDRTKNTGVFIIWRNNARDILVSRGEIKTDKNAGFDYYTDSNKMSFKLQLIF